ncbi:MAG: TetR/AcrR family transcriptional regulator [Alphaproteobacteria bacterium]|nr:MAG: TetR/AcrR family transcriptional regulator [Alphaproteobacteria bacterium]
MPYRRTENVVRRLAARREAIMQAAGALAAEAGIAAVQITPVSRRAGVATGTVYRYFPSKDELVGALVHDVAEREIGAMRRAADAAPGPLSALAAAITTYAARALGSRKLAFALIAEPADAADDARLAFRAALAAELGRRVSAAVQAGLLPGQDIAVAAPALTGALIEGLIGPLAADARDETGTRDAVQALTLFALRGLGVADARARGLVVGTTVPGRERGG